ncbi:MAG: metallophosphoesterase family protein [Candidatus Hydrogenedentes bacterium]|nr:metallophosphoesterase family protein [Candidatus Hydrogenedentota bacterium]
MKYAIISDIHANLEALQAVLDAIEEMGIEKIVCLGDVVGYNASPNECCEVLREREIPTILGNHDAVACGLEEPWGFNPVALAAALWTRETLTRENLHWLNNLPDALNFGYFVCVHGAPKNRNTYLFRWEDVIPHLSFLKEQNCDICMVGHTHSPGIFSTDGVYSVDDDQKFFLGEGKDFFINPGSVGQPRDNDPRAAFGILDTDAKVYEQARVKYPVEKAASRVMEAGLPQFLAERLSLGR